MATMANGRMSPDHMSQLIFSYSCDGFLQVSVVGDTVNVSGQSNCTPVKVPECRLSEDMGSMFERSLFSDVTLCVGGREFQAHKATLAGMLRSLL